MSSEDDRSPVAPHVLRAEVLDGKVWIEVLTPVYQVGQPGMTRVLHVPMEVQSALEAAYELLQAAGKAAEQRPRS
ncbi:MAG: hypothetical protein F4Y45_00610 [Acidobacteria bacterium]|nr:hypothetical protein [Acidobacteriota bacterium]MYD70273.1 hypothetical protein [Acidobacteriota bacterium]MYJ05738.1 hypothetical protein [Acidobacteriota bacterium]